MMLKTALLKNFDDYVIGQEQESNVCIAYKSPQTVAA
jgi:hypothetical protein